MFHEQGDGSQVEVATKQTMLILRYVEKAITGILEALVQTEYSGPNDYNRVYETFPRVYILHTMKVTIKS